MKSWRSWRRSLVLLIGLTVAVLARGAERQTISLDGAWQVGEGSLAQRPGAFDRSVPVPGLLDMATPRFEVPGSTVSLDERGKPWLKPCDPRREAFWYRRTFKVDGPVRSVAKLKINKARYGTKVWLNGQVVGEHGPNFTPAWFDVRPFLKGDGIENELVIRVGASLAQVPANLTDGWDNEKSRYIPGIYDSVSLLLCDAPHVVNVQVVPDVARGSARAVVELEGPAAGVTVRGSVREARSGKGSGEVSVESRVPGKVEIEVPIRDARCWTPEDPFLYEFVVDTGGDKSVTRFGLRTIATDAATGRFLLNGKPYFLRGSNVCIYRFFEDASRGSLPWDEAWVRRLHQSFRDMHWNSLRYCIGFPPEAWYRIADEEGILIQDEFPIWYSRAKDGWPEAITVDDLVVEYTEWMRERWNHPCVMIWDAQNETANDRVTGAALMRVRDLDLSRRPWDNGWGTPQKDGDISESHPYRAGGKGFSLERFATETGIPDNGPRKKGAARPPYLINEYGWLWINRDGSLPTLTVDVYKRLLGENATVAQRFEYYARTLAAKTEFWRMRRKCAGVLHFCGLGYARADGQTSDNFCDLKELKYEPNFYRYVRDSFAPVGVGIDYWKQTVAPGSKETVRVVVINDLEKAWEGEVRLRWERGGKVIFEESRPVKAGGFELGTAEFGVVAPAEACSTLLTAEIMGVDGKPVRSLRDVRVAETQAKK